MEGEQRQPQPDQQGITAASMQQVVGSSQSTPASSRSSGSVTTTGAKMSASVATDVPPLPPGDVNRNSSGLEGDGRNLNISANANMARGVSSSNRSMPQSQSQSLPLPQSLPQSQPQPQDQGSQHYGGGMENSSNSSSSSGRSSLPVPPYAPFPDHANTGMHGAPAHRHSHYPTSGSHHGQGSGQGSGQGPGPGQGPGQSHPTSTSMNHMAGGMPHHMRGPGSGGGHPNYYGGGPGRGDSGNHSYMHQHSQGHGHGHGHSNQAYGHGGPHSHGYGHPPPPSHHHHRRQHHQQHHQHQHQHHNPHHPSSPYSIDPTPATHAQPWLRQSSRPPHSHGGGGGGGSIHASESFSAPSHISGGGSGGGGPMNTPAKKSYDYHSSSGDNNNAGNAGVNINHGENNNSGNDMSSNKNDEKEGKAGISSNDETKTPADTSIGGVKASGVGVGGGDTRTSYANTTANNTTSAVAITIGKDSSVNHPHDSNPNSTSTATMKEELPRRVLQFEPSPKGKTPPAISPAPGAHGGDGATNPSSGGASANPLPVPADADANSNINDSSTFDKMTPLDGRHQSRVEHHHHQQHYDSLQQSHSQQYGTRRHEHEHSQYGQGQGYGHGHSDHPHVPTQPIHSPYDFYSSNRNDTRTATGAQPAPADYRRDPHPYHPPPPHRGHGPSASGSSASLPSHDYDRHGHSHEHGGGDHNVNSGYHSSTRHGRHPASSPSFSGSRYHHPGTYPSQQKQQHHSNPPPHQSQKDDYGQSHQSMQQYGSLQPSPALDRMPLMDINSNTDSATKFDDLMVSPAVGMSGRGRGNKRRTTYDLHDQPIFNDQQHHSSPPSLMRNTSATRYCTPIVTGGNDRSRVAPNGSFSGQSEKNYRPSPPGGDSAGRGSSGGRYDPDYDSHMRHFHRPYPTIRGGQPSPTRYDDHPPPPPPPQPAPDRYNAPPSGTSPPGMYATPVFPRGGSGPVPSAGGPDPSSARVGSHNHGARLPPPTSYYDPQMPYHHNPHPPMYHRDPYSAHGHGSHHPPYNMHGQMHGAPYYSPYDQGHGHPHGHVPPPDYSHISDKKRRRDAEKPKKNAKQPRRKKMYSDYVGVTYNKTHAKFQACITHYRKQHYLGRYKLAVDAAKAYDQSAKLLKGDGWKINFQNEKEYELAKDKELREVEEKRQASGMDSYALRKSYEATFPSTEMLREKLGLNAKAPEQKPSATAPVSAPVPVQQLTSHSGERMSGKGSTEKPAPLQQVAASAESKPHTSQHHTAATTSQNNSSNLNTAVTPSPNVQNLNKGNVLMNEPLMSPGFVMGDSPSADYILGTGTPFSMPNSSLKMGMSSTIKAQRPSDNTPSELDMVASNIFSSPKPNTPNAGGDSNEKNESEKKDKAEKKEPEKGKGDLAAASALLMIGN